MSEEIARHIISLLIQETEDANTDYLNDKTEYNSGYSLACYCILDTIKNELSANDIDLSKFGLDIDLEEKFLH